LKENKNNEGKGGADKRKEYRALSKDPVNGHVLSKEEFEEFLSWKASKVLEAAMEEVLWRMLPQKWQRKLKNLEMAPRKTSCWVGLIQ